MVIRYYGREIDPSILVNTGWKGRFVRFYAIIIAWLQRKIEWHLMHILAKQSGATKELIKNLETVFEAENKKKRNTALVGMVNTDLVDKRYIARKSSGEDPKTYRQNRSMRMQEFLARYANVGRAGAYRYARNQRLASPDGDVDEGET